MHPRFWFTLAILALPLAAADLTGNWVVSQDMQDGTFRHTYFDLRQDGERIGGTIHVTQFFYKIAECTDGPSGFVITSSMINTGHKERRVVVAL